MKAPDVPKIRIRGLHKAFGEKHVLRGLDLDVGVGESVVVIGGSGTVLDVEASAANLLESVSVQLTLER